MEIMFFELLSKIFLWDRMDGSKNFYDLDKLKLYIC